MSFEGCKEDGLTDLKGALIHTGVVSAYSSSRGVGNTLGCHGDRARVVHCLFIAQSSRGKRHDSLILPQKKPRLRGQAPQ